MISRIWHGWTSYENANAYEHLLRTEIFEGIVARTIDGFMWFASVPAVQAFAGSDYEVAVVPPAARALLRRFDARSAHYEVRERRVPTEI